MDDKIAKAIGALLGAVQVLMDIEMDRQDPGSTARRKLTEAYVGLYDAVKN